MSVGGEPAWSHVWAFPPFLREDLPQVGHALTRDRRLRAVWLGAFVLALWGGTTLVVYRLFALYLEQPEWAYSYFLSRYLYLIPILVAGFLLGRSAAVFVGLVSTALFVPRGVQLFVEAGLSAATVETLGLLVLYNLVPLLISSLVEFSRRQARLWDTVNQLGQVIEMTLDPRALLPLVSRQSLVLGEADGAQMCFKVTGTWHGEAGWSLSDEPDWSQDMVALDPRSLLAWILEQERFITLPNVADDPRFDVPAELAAKRPVLIAFPLRRVGKTAGVLILWRYWGDRFARDDVKALRVLADKVQMAIENAWLHSQTDRKLAKRAEELTMLLNATNTFTSTIERRQLLETLCRYVVDVIGASFCRVFLVNEAEQGITIRAAYSVPDLVWDPGVGSVFSLEALPWHRWVINSGQPLVMRIEDYRYILKEPEFSVTFCAGAKSVLLLPLRVKHRCLGVAVVGERRFWERTPFDKQKVELCLSMARQASLALENIVALESVEAQRRQIQLIIDNVADGVFSTDLDGVITAFNPAAERITGFRAEEVIGLACHEAFARDGETTCALCFGECPVEAVLSRRAVSETVQRKEWIRDGGGERRLVVHTVAPLAYGDAHVGGTVSVIRDVSREEELIRLKSEFISLVSHQLRTPLAGIRMSVELLSQEQPDGELRQDLLDVLNRQCRRLSRLVDQVLTASRLEKAQTAPMLEPLALLPIVRQTVDMYRTQHPERHFLVEAEGGPAFILGDQAAVEVILENLLQNAVKYSPPDRPVRVFLHQESEAVRLTVADEGVGIAPDQVEHVFQPFRRLVRDTKRDDTYGFGLGLYITKRLVEDQGGSIWVESRVGEGARFHVKFPKLQAEVNHVRGEDSRRR